MSERHFVRVRSLKSGMKIDQSIIDKTGRILLARGTTLDDYLIASLQKLGINGVYIREGEDELIESEENAPVSKETLDTIERLRVSDRARVTLTESVKQRVAEGMSYLYSNTASEDFADATKTIANDLMKAISTSDSLAFDINMLKVSDEYTFKHSVDVATMSMVIAKKQGMSDSDVYSIGISGLLHDIGKSKISTDILNKQGRLTEDEFEIMKQHASIGYEILKDNNDIDMLVKIGVLQHHEKINGKGYPVGIMEHQISEYAKIMAVADIYDALVTERPYKKAFTQRDAVEMIMTMTDELDITAMRSFMKSVILYPVDSTVILSNGERARVVENYAENVLRPKVVGLKTGKVYELATDLSCANIIIQ